MLNFVLVLCARNLVRKDLFRKSVSIKYKIIISLFQGETVHT